MMWAFLSMMWRDTTFFVGVVLAAVAAGVAETVESRPRNYEVITFFVFRFSFRFLSCAHIACKRRGCCVDDAPPPPLPAKPPPPTSGPPLYREAREKRVEVGWGSGGG